MIIIDASGVLLGRFATVAAKHAILGNEVHVINAEQALISGASAVTIAKFTQRRERGAPLIGPYYPKQPHMIVKRVIRGMIPHRSAKGRDAFAKVRCHVGVPAEFVGKETVSFKKASTLPEYKYISIAEIAKRLGGRV